MELNADFTRRVVVHAGRIDWVASPMPGVERRMLDRIGGEVARATTIVRFAPGSVFSAHTHGGGEEYLVLDGVFQDEDGDHPAGTYVRNPPTTRHTPASGPGCTLFVKLWQFDPDDRTCVRVDTNEAPLAANGQPGVKATELHRDANEHVTLEHWEPEAEIALDAPGGLEILALDGGFAEGGEAFEAQSWLRLPAGGAARAIAGPDGARVWIKRGHLARPPRAPG